MKKTKTEPPLKVVVHRLGTPDWKQRYSKAVQILMSEKRKQQVIEEPEPEPPTQVA